MATAIIPSKKPTPEQVLAAASIYRRHQIAASKQLVAATNTAHAAIQRQLRKAGLDHVTEEQIRGYLERLRKSQPPTEEQLAARAKNNREYAESLLRHVGTRLADVGTMSEAVADGKFDELGEESVGRFTLLACVQASKELVEAARLLGFKNFSLCLSEMGV